MLLGDLKPKPGTHIPQTVCFSPVQREEMVTVTEISGNRAMSAWGPEGEQGLVRVSVTSAQMPPAEETPALSPELTVQAIGAPSWAHCGLQRGRLQPGGHLPRPGRSPETQRGGGSEAEEGGATLLWALGTVSGSGGYSFPLRGVGNDYPQAPG